MMMMTLFLRRLENVYFQHTEGLVDESALQSYGLQDLTSLMKGERFEWYWQDRGWRSDFHPDFVAYIEGEASQSSL